MSVRESQGTWVLSACLWHTDLGSGVPARRAQAGGFCVGMPLVCRLLHVRGSLSSCVFVCSTVFAFWGHALLSARIPPSLSFTVLACSTSENGALRVLPRLRNGVSVLGSRWAGSACFALALPSLCARSPGCGCLCLRLDFQVTVSVRGGSRESTLGAFSTRTLKSSGVPHVD